MAKFPADYDGSETGGKRDGGMFERAQKKAKSMNIARPKEEDMGDQAPKGKRTKRNKKERPERPSTKVPKAEEAVDAEGERSSSISGALLRGAALVPDSPVSGTLRGLLGGASVGMDIGAAMAKYQKRKKDETAANAAMKMDAPTYQPKPTPSNIPPGALGQGKRKKEKDQQATDE